ncbi:ABC transporter permease [Chamaesiphon minutus]|uniref:Transport permease protein n=1 Tax=Chamaesiphon minutus (strain ATCC 27169 / PCC 6605) TaxID=1173020 RepID=K9UQ10_CHAP6|nr:ABC transporter permease [Chamaesiphon minutus]AFY96895.1 ABC-type multidrug transport system, permease component [Chamaesiphon minutus PCC 6605]
MFVKFLRSVIPGSFWALVVKEVREILRSKELVILLTLAPILQILLYGFTLNPDTTKINLGVVDYAHVAESRELISALTENKVFVLKQYQPSQAKLGEQVREGNITIGLVIPPNFKRQLDRNRPADLQILVDGVDANTAGIASAYLLRILQEHGRQLLPNIALPLIRPAHTFLYNPGLISGWFFVPGVIGITLTLVSSLVSALTVIREKDVGTLEQLLMTPAAIWEILLAKIVPLFILLMGTFSIALGVARLVFGVPLRGNLFLLLLLSGLYLFVGIGIGILLATVSKNQQQVVLTAFFANIPLIQLSGAIAPIDSMPEFLRYLSILNPLRHYIRILRGILLKGIGIDMLYPNVFALLLFAAFFLTISIRQFRKQLT